MTKTTTISSHMIRRALLALVAVVCALLLFAHPAHAEEEGIYTYTVSGGNATITNCSKKAEGTIAIPSSLGGKKVTAIGESAFKDCNKITSVVLPSTITQVGAYAFEKCMYMTSATLSPSLAALSPRMFYECYSLNNVVVPNGVKSIGDQAFEWCIALKSIDIPQSVSSIGYAAFRNCRALEEIKTPSSVKDLGSYGFYNCYMLKSMDLSASLTVINKGTFENCSRLLSATIPDGVTKIADDAFNSCASIKSLYIPTSVSSIGASAFASCQSLANVYYSGTQAQWSKIAFGAENTLVTKAALHPKATEIPADYIPSKPATGTSDGTQGYYERDEKPYEDPSCTKPIANLDAWKVIPRIKTIKLSATSYTYNGKVKTPSLTIKDAKGNKIASKNYTVKKSSGRKNVGTYTYKITFKGNYSGTKTLSFKINPKGTSAKPFVRAKKSFTVSWGKQASKMSKSRITGYQVRYSLKSNMTKATTKTVKGYASTKLTVKKLKAKKRYYVQVRTYMKVSGKTYYSAWSKTKSVMTK